MTSTAVHTIYIAMDLTITNFSSVGFPISPCFATGTHHTFPANLSKSQDAVNPNPERGRYFYPKTPYTSQVYLSYLKPHSPPGFTHHYLNKTNEAPHLLNSLRIRFRQVRPVSAEVSRTGG